VLPKQAAKLKEIPLLTWILEQINYIVTHEPHVLSRELWGMTSSVTKSPYLIPSAYASSGLAVDESCSTTGTNASSLSCTLNHAANAVIFIFAMINNFSNNGGAVSSVNIGGLEFNATSQTINGNNTTLKNYIDYYYLPYASDDAVTVNYSGASNNTEAMAAVSFTGGNTTVPFSNDLSQTACCSSATNTSLAVVAGEANRLVLNSVFLTSNATITPGSSQTRITQANTTGASVEVDYQSTSAAATVTSSWAGSTVALGTAFALLPPNQILTDGAAIAGTGQNRGTISSSISGTINGTNYTAGAVCVVGVAILNTFSQTVTSVQQANGNTAGSYGSDKNYSFYTASTNSANIRTELWFTDESIGGTTGTITVTLSASANAVMVVQCFTGAKMTQLFEGLATNTGNSETASSGNVVGANTAGRRILLIAGFAVAVAPNGSQGVNEITEASNGAGILLNYYDSSSTTNMQATDISSQWSAIGVALLPYPITVNAICSDTSASSAATSCTLNHSANVLILVSAGNDGSSVDTPSSVTVGGQPATLLNITGTNVIGLAIYEYYSTSAGNDSIVVNWTHHNTNESLIAVSLFGTRSSTPFINALATTGGQSNVTSGGVDGETGGEANSFTFYAVETGANNNFYQTQSTSEPNSVPAQVSGNSNSMVVITNQCFGNRTPTAIWGTSTVFKGTMFRVDPANQVVMDGITGGGGTGGENVTGSTNVASSISATCNLPSHDPDVLVIVNVALVDSSSQTVSGVSVGSTSATQLATIANGTSVSNDVWYLYDNTSSAETITVTLSASAAMGITCAAYANTASAGNCIPSSNCFEQPATADSDSGTASVTVNSGTASRAFLLSVGEGANATITGQQGADWELANSSTSRLSEEINVFEAASSQAYTMTSTFPSNNWAAIGTAILNA